MAKLKSEGHHWWPECVSKHWEDVDGCTNWLLPSGEVRRAPAKNFGVIGNGHRVKLQRNGEASAWDYSFERVFSAADSAFPEVIGWLEQLDRSYITPRTTLREGFLSQDVSDEKIRALLECLVSLAVRSPRFRDTAVALADHLRGAEELKKHERNTITALNMSSCQRVIADSLKAAGGKLAVLYSHAREFIFGDGFYCNLSSSTRHSFGTKMLVPMTPQIAVLHANPRRYVESPKLVTVGLSDEEVNVVNTTVEVYARNALFYRAEPPRLLDVFSSGKHLIYADGDPITDWIEQLSGVPSRQGLYGF